MKTATSWPMLAMTSALALYGTGFGADGAEPPGHPAAGLVAPGATSAELPGGSSREAGPESPPGAIEHTFSGKISAVNRDEQTITVQDGVLGTQRLRIGETTKLKRGQAAGSWDDLQVGKAVTGVSRGQPGEAQVDWLEVGG